MKFKLDLSQIKTMMKLNLASIIIIGFCEIFAIAVFINKGLNGNVEKWRFVVYITIVGIITLLLIASIFLFVYFLRLINKGKQ